MTTEGKTKLSDEFEITNHRADATQNESLIGMARVGADAFGYRAELRIDRGLAQLLRLRVSQINNCSYCLNLHYEAAGDAWDPAREDRHADRVVGD
jgi:alkylhydroperoxidase family enzyme